MQRTLLAAACALWLAGCVNQNTWTPTVDTYGDPNAWRLSQDEAQCRQLAMQSSGGSVKNTAEGVGIGGLLGAAAGGFGGGAYESFDTSSAFKSAFDQCLRQRGHDVIS